MPQQVLVRNDERHLERVVACDPVADDVTGNASYVLAYTGDELTTVTKVLNGVSYSKTLTWTGGKLTAVSVWVES